MTDPIWKDKFYTITNEDSVNYFILNELTGTVIHRGKAVIEPSTGRIDIPINSIVSSYVSNNLEESFFTEKRYESYTGVFSLYINDVLTEKYSFRPDWSYEKTKYSISEPINGHYIPSKEIWISQEGVGKEYHDFTIATPDTFSSNGGSQYLCIQNNSYFDSFNTQHECPWLTIDMIGGCFVLNVSPNTSNEDRYCQLCIYAIKGEDTTYKYVFIKQEGLK